LKERAGLAPENEQHHKTTDPDIQIVSGALSVLSGVGQIVGGVALSLAPTGISQIGGGVLIMLEIGEIGFGGAALAEGMAAKDQGRLPQEIPTGYGDIVGTETDKSLGGDGNLGGYGLYGIPLC
jgi:hypothetical protein